MVDTITIQKITLKPTEASYGTKKVITRNGKKLEVTIPPGVKKGTLVKLSGALLTTDGYSGDLYVQISISSTRVLAYAISVIAIVFVIVSSVVIFKTDNNSGNLSEGTNYITVFNNKQPDKFTNYGKPIQLVNNPAATNPSWRELRDFIVSDKTDQQPYVDYSYECASYAEEVHNHAEARGIKTAFLSITFLNSDTGHALNAFLTSDRGLVYIDCTGISNSVGCDKVDYIEKGKELGAIRIAEASSFDYNYYKNFQDKEFEPLGIVEHVDIYW